MRAHGDQPAGHFGPHAAQPRGRTSLAFLDPVYAGSNARALTSMAKKVSAGILLYRLRGHVVEVFLVHPGGPYWAHKDEGAWSIPKGEAAEGADLLATACTEFHEETGSPLEGRPLPLDALKQPGGKLIHAWAVRGDIDAASVRSNTFAIEWPPRSGKTQEFPEVDRAGWFDLPAARQKLLPGQRAFLDQLQSRFGF